MVSNTAIAHEVSPCLASEMQSMDQVRALLVGKTVWFQCGSVMNRGVVTGLAADGTLCVQYVDLSSAAAVCLRFRTAYLLAGACCAFVGVLVVRKFQDVQVSYDEPLSSHGLLLSACELLCGETVRVPSVAGHLLGVVAVPADRRAVLLSLPGDVTPIPARVARSLRELSTVVSL